MKFEQFNDKAKMIALSQFELSKLTGGKGDTGIEDDDDDT